ncbi:MAG TPA: hypothetical protein VGG64_25560 [Pirellulales bacterium]|jgi:hypothetical protein
MDADNVWRDFFHKWPKDLPHRGVLVTNFNEQIPFDGFMTTETMLLVERRTPDTIGARKLIMPYGNVVAIKLTDVVKAKAFAASGFAGDLPNQG